MKNILIKNGMNFHTEDNRIKFEYVREECDSEVDFYNIYLHKKLIATYTCDANYDHSGRCVDIGKIRGVYCLYDPSLYKNAKQADNNYDATLIEMD